MGLTMITVVNREYCKKLIVLLPGQQHPEQFHKLKEETFQLLHGDLKVVLDDREFDCQVGEVLTVERNVRHKFWSEHGAIVEEVSSTHAISDSFYTDPEITRNAHRKTFLTYWLE
jgi:N-acetylneuraminate synthase